MRSVAGRIELPVTTVALPVCMLTVSWSVAPGLIGPVLPRLVPLRTTRETLVRASLVTMNWTGPAPTEAGTRTRAGR